MKRPMALGTNFGDDMVSGIAAGMMAEARRTGEGAGLAAAFAAGTQPIQQRREDRMKAASAFNEQTAMQELDARRHAHDVDGFVALPAGGFDVVRATLDGDMPGIMGPPAPGPPQPLDESDRGMMLATMPGPITYERAARAVSGEDPSGLEAVTFGSTNGRPAISFTDARGQVQVMTLSESQWLTAMRARASARAAVVERAEAMKKLDEQRQAMGPVMQKMFKDSRVLGDPAVQAAAMAMFNEDPAGVVDRLMAIRIAERQDQQKAAQAARQMVIGQNEQRAAAGLKALGSAIDSWAGQMEQRAGVAAAGVGPQGERIGRVAGMRADVLRAQAAAHQLGPLVAQGDETLMSSPMAVHGDRAADILLDLVTVGADGGEPLPYVPEGELQHEDRVGRILARVMGLSRQMGYTGVATPAEEEMVRRRLAHRAGRDVGSGMLDAFGGMQPMGMRPGGPSMADYEVADASVRAADSDREKKTREAEAQEMAEARAEIKDSLEVIDKAIEAETNEARKRDLLSQRERLMALLVATHGGGAAGSKAGSKATQPSTSPTPSARNGFTPQRMTNESPRLRGNL